MRFGIKYSRIGNKFFFISNLSEWHFSCRVGYNKAWLKKGGPLTTEEEEALKNFRPILQKNGFGKKYLGKFFYIYPENQAWRALKEEVFGTDFNIIKNTFEILESRFEKIWRDNKKEERIRILRQVVNSKRFKALIEDTESIFYGGKLEKKINAVVIFSPMGPEKTAAGGANVNGLHLTIEIPELKEGTWQLDQMAGVLAHETAHNLLGWREGRKLIEKTLKKLNLPKSKMKHFPMNFYEILNESVISSFVPNGYLGQKYSDYRLSSLFFGNLDFDLDDFEKLKKGKKIESYHGVIRYIAATKIFPLALKYGKAGKKIDENFVYQAGKAIKDSL